MANRIENLFHITYPIIQAPMAGGITTNRLVSEVSNHGGLGMIGAGYMNADTLLHQIKAIKQETASPFGVNVFVPGMVEYNDEKISASKQSLQSFYNQYGINADDIHLPAEKALIQNYEKQLEYIIQEKITVCSFTFGVPEEEIIYQLHHQGIVVVGTATTLKEAHHIQELGMDAVVLQGIEAGGHRGAFLDKGLESQLGLMSFIPQASDLLHIPIIASGGMMDKRGVDAAFRLGADAVQLGTAFLLTEESGAHVLHKNEIIQSNGDEAVLTKAFSGKYARGIRNEFIEQMKHQNDMIPGYPVQNALTQPLRKAAKSENNKEHMSLWSGQSSSLGKMQTVKELMVELVKDK